MYILYLHTYFIIYILYLKIFFFLDILEKLKPNCVSPVVAWLCHENCPESGGVFEAAGGWIGKCKLIASFISSYIIFMLLKHLLIDIVSNSN